MESWYLIHTKPRQERQAQENLVRQGYEGYLPLALVSRRRRGRAVRVVEPMFPRYLFIHLSDETDDWRPIRSTIGVSTLVKFGQNPARIPDQLIEELRQLEDKDGLQPIIQQEFREGDRVSIAEGPLAGYEGIFQSKVAKERVILLLEMSQKFVRFELPANHISLN